MMIRLSVVIAVLALLVSCCNQDEPKKRELDAGTDASTDGIRDWFDESELDGSLEPEPVDLSGYSCESTVEIDEANDGVVDQRFVTSFDREGNPVVEEWDRNGDGQADVRWILSFQEEGEARTETEGWDREADGEIDARRTRRYRCYNTTGIFATNTCDLEVEETDSNADGTVDERWELIYDASNNLIGEQLDKDGDGAADAIWYAEYNDNDTSNPRKIEWDKDGDGSADLILSFVRDEAGNLLRKERDNDGDGTVDESQTRIGFDPDHYLEYTVEWDKDMDGLADVRAIVEEFQGGSKGEYDGDADGIPEFTMTESASNPLEDSPATVREWDDDEDGEVDRRETYVFVSNDENLRELDEDADGNIDYREHYVNSNGTGTDEYSWDTDDDGTVDTRCVVSEGKTECDVDADGIADFSAARFDSDGCLVTGLDRFANYYSPSYLPLPVSIFRGEYHPEEGLAPERSHEEERETRSVIQNLLNEFEIVAERHPMLLWAYSNGIFIYW